MPFATDQITRIETLLAENLGVKSVVVGNTNVPYESRNPNGERKGCTAGFALLAE